MMSEVPQYTLFRVIRYRVALRIAITQSLCQRWLQFSKQIGQCVNHLFAEQAVCGLRRLLSRRADSPGDHQRVRATGAVAFDPEPDRPVAAVPPETQYTRINAETGAGIIAAISASPGFDGAQQG